MSYTSGLAKIIHISFSDTSCYYHLIRIYARVDLCWTQSSIRVELFSSRNLYAHCRLSYRSLHSFSLNERCLHWIYLPLFSLLVTVFPSIPLSSGPAEQLLSQERLCVLACWVTFRGRLPLSPKKHNIQAVGCKRRNFGQENCGLLCLHDHNTDCSNARWLPQRLTAGSALSVRSEAAAFGCKQVWKKLQDEWLLRPRRGNAGTSTWLSAISEHRGGPIMTVVFHDPEILSHPSDTAASLTVGLRGKILLGQWLAKVFEKLRQRRDHFSPQPPDIWLKQNISKWSPIMWKCLQIKADNCREL